MRPLHKSQDKGQVLFKSLFDLKYERNIHEAVVFFFFYVIYAYFTAGVLNSLANIFHYEKCFAAIFLVPFLFYTTLSITIIKKKNLKEPKHYMLVLYTGLITLAIPAIFAIAFCRALDDFKYNYIFFILVGFLPALALGCVPSTILSTKEDLSLSKIVQKNEEEWLKQKEMLEKQLMIEQALSKSFDELKLIITENKRFNENSKIKKTKF